MRQGKNTPFYPLDCPKSLKSYIIDQIGSIPSNITVQSWYSFLLQEGVRPYQNHLIEGRRINSINFTNEPPRFVRKTEDAYYLTSANNIYRDRVAAFICECDNQTRGLILKRLEKIYAHIFIDELQDMAGFDLDILEKLFRSSIPMTAVGDPRQATYTTNNGPKNYKFKKIRIAEWIEQQRKIGLISVEKRMECYRSNQAICDFADRLFPSMPKTKSMNNQTTGHDGIFPIKNNQVHDYFNTHKPVVLRYDRRADTMDIPAINIGLAKGRTYDRVLIFPTKKMKAYLKTNDLSTAGDLAKLYVAITRARYSVCFVVD